MIKQEVGIPSVPNTDSAAAISEKKPQKKAQKPRTIRTPGSSVERVSQACDRCRAKKTRCDGKKPCSQCASVGLECKISDKLSRRAFPRGYTETLEERIRELELENKKLSKLIDLKNEEVNIVTKSTNPNLAESMLTDENLRLFNNAKDDLNQTTTHTHHDGTPCFCNNYPHSVHERPVSIAGSVDLNNTINNNNEHTKEDDDLLYDTYNDSEFDDTDYDNYNEDKMRHKERLVNQLRKERNYNYNNVSFEQVNAPGAALAISLQKKLQNQNFINLSTLVAMSVPRTTAETLFIPSLLLKICNVHGFNSKLAITTLKSIAGLKENYQDMNSYIDYSNNFSLQNINFGALSKKESILFFQKINLPNQVNLDLFITNFFNNWNKVIPILNKQQFLVKYLKFNKSRESNFEDGLMYKDEKFVETLVLIITLVMLSQERQNSSMSANGTSDVNISSNGNGTNNSNNTTSPPHIQPQQLKQESSPKMFKDNSNFEILQYYNHIIHKFIRSDINRVASLSTIQNLSLELLYCLNIGDLESSYNIRGKLITMGQQLRLHRCPSAVLGNNGSTVSQLQQGERRILFWCTYTLDTFSALILGVPRLLKDYEIECALPFSNEEQHDNLATGNDINDTNLVIINNDKLSLVGKVCNLALLIMRYSKILGNVVDSIFKRNENNNEDFLLVYENLLNHWKKNLPTSLRFDEIDTTKIDLFNHLDEQQLLLVFLYYYAKILLYLPNLSKELVTTKSSSTYIIIQQSTALILNITNILLSQLKSFYYLPLPFNLSREKLRISLLYLKGSLEYTRGGALFQDSKNLLQSIINDLKIENGIGMLGCLSDSCIDNLDLAIESILSQPGAKRSSGIKKKQSNTVKGEEHDIFKVPSPPNLLLQQQRNPAVARKPSLGHMQMHQQHHLDHILPIQQLQQQQPQPQVPIHPFNPLQYQDVASASAFKVPQYVKQQRTPPRIPAQSQTAASTAQQTSLMPLMQQLHAPLQSEMPDLADFGDTLLDFTVDGSLGLNSLLDFDFDFDMQANSFNTTNGTAPAVNGFSPNGQSSMSIGTPSENPSAADSSESNSLFSWQQQQSKKSV